MMQSPFNDESERSRQFASNLGSSWANHFPSNNAAINQEILKPVVPLLVESFAELMKAVQRENQSMDQHSATQALNPSMLPMNRIQPLHFIASYLMQHHPKHQTTQQSQDQSEEQSDEQLTSTVPVNPEYEAYKEAMNEVVNIAPQQEQ